MATALESPRVKPQATTSLLQGKPARISLEPPRKSEMLAEDAEAGLDWIFIRVCIACGVLLVGLHLYEFIRWMLG